MVDTTFGIKLKQLRKAQGLTQAQLAEKIGITEKHISKIEAGLYFPKYLTLNKILLTLNLKIEDVGLDLKNINNTPQNPYYTKFLKILNTATESELEYYYKLIKAAKKWTNSDKLSEKNSNRQ